MAGSEVLEALESNQIDLAIASEVPATRGYRLTSLFVEHLELAVPPGHPLAQRRSVRPIDLHCMRLALLTKNYVTRGVIDQYLADAGAVPIVAAELSSPETLTSFALRASLPIIGPKGALSDMADFLKVPLVSPVPGRPMVAIIREGMSMSNVAGEFVKLIQEVWESSQNESTEETPQ
jgi:LysR family cyn operon transcriptional activator